MLLEEITKSCDLPTKNDERNEGLNHWIGRKELETYLVELIKAVYSCYECNLLTPEGLAFV